MIKRVGERMEWLIPCKTTKYNIFEAFENLEFVYWIQSANYNVKDIVFIYCSKPIQRVMFKCQVEEINISSLETIYGKEYWIRESDYQESLKKTFTKFKLVEKIDSEKLSLNKLLGQGLKKAPQGPMKVRDNLLLYINNAFKENTASKAGSDNNTNIQQIKKRIFEFANERNWLEVHNPKNLAMSIAIEASELMEIFQWCTSDDSWTISKTEEREHIEEELSDIMIYCISLANQLDIDMSSAILGKIEKNGIKYPINK